MPVDLTRAAAGRPHRPAAPPARSARWSSDRGASCSSSPPRRMRLSRASSPTPPWPTRSRLDLGPGRPRAAARRRTSTCRTCSREPLAVELDSTFQRVVPVRAGRPAAGPRPGYVLERHRRRAGHRAAARPARADPADRLGAHASRSRWPTPTARSRRRSRWTHRASAGCGRCRQEVTVRVDVEAVRRADLDGRAGPPAERPRPAASAGARDRGRPGARRRRPARRPRRATASSGRGLAGPIRAQPGESGSGCSAPAGVAATRGARQHRPGAAGAAMAEWILGIETSCDETSAAVLRTRTARGAELARARHPVAGRAPRSSAASCPSWPAARTCRRSARSWTARWPTPASGSAQLDGIAVTAGPGLVGALLVGVMYAKTLAFSLDRPLIGVNHLEGHLFAPTLEDPELAPPFVGLLVSGGHTMLLDVPAWGEYRLLGPDARRRRRRGLRQGGQAARPRLSGRPGDRAAGPRGQPGALSASLARCCRSSSATGPAGTRSRSAASRPRCCGRCVRRRRTTLQVADLARGFQDAAIDVLAAKTAHAVEALGLRDGDDRRRRRLQSRPGGAQLRERLAGRARVSVASPRLNTDNAAMIAAAGAWRLARGERSGWDLEPRDDLPLPGLTIPFPFPDPRHDHLSLRSLPPSSRSRSPATGS